VYESQGNCTDQESFTVTIGTTPGFDITGDCQGNDYVLEVVPTNGFDPQGATYAWSSSNGGTFKDGITDTQSVSVLSDATYSVVVTYQGCQRTESFDGLNTDCSIQKGISANGDGNNDYFDLEGQGVRQLDIFNRYGMMVFSMANYTNQWYGQTDKGEELPDGTYYYVIKRSSGESITGWIYISRAQN
jgi:gliding motility-associated-like protein